MKVDKDVATLRFGVSLPNALRGYKRFGKNKK